MWIVVVVTAWPGCPGAEDLRSVRQVLEDYSAATSGEAGRACVTMCLEEVDADLALNVALREVRAAGLTGDLLCAEVMTGAELERRLAVLPFPLPRSEVP